MKKRTNLLKTMTALGLTLALGVTALAGCGAADSSSGGNDSTGSSSSNSDLEPVTLKLWSFGDKYSAQDEVLAAFCEKYKDQLNIEKIEYNFVSFGDYEDKMTSLVAGGDDFDGFYVADWMLYSKMANKGAFLPLDDLMQQYAPTLYQTYQDNGTLSACSIDGQLVALPWTKQKSSKPVLFYRKDLAEQYGVDTSNLSTIEDLDAFLTE